MVAEGSKHPSDTTEPYLSKKFEHAELSYITISEWEEIEIGKTWRGWQGCSRFPKPGCNGTHDSGCGSRDAYWLQGLLTPAEAMELRRLAQRDGSELEYRRDLDSVDRRPSYFAAVVERGEYLDSELEHVLRPIVDSRLLPFVRRRYGAIDPVVSYVLLRRFLPDERRVHPTHFDADAYATAVVCLNPGEFVGGLYVQASAHASSRSYVPLGAGDMIVHRYDLQHGVQVLSGCRYSLIFWLKDSWEACLADSTPWYDMAARAGDADAQCNMAMNLHLGNGGLEKNVALAAEWYKRAAVQGQPIAQMKLGHLYMRGEGGLERDPAEAIVWWRRSAELGHRSSQRLLGSALFDGDGIEQERLEGLAWLEAAAAQDDADAMYLLSRIHGRSWSSQALAKVMPQGGGLARGWLERAGQLGHATAQFDLATASIKGRFGVPGDLKEGLIWAWRAANNGHRRAQVLLASMLFSGVGSGKRREEAWRWYAEAAEGDARTPGKLNLDVFSDNDVANLAWLIAERGCWHSEENVLTAISAQLGDRLGDFSSEELARVAWVLGGHSHRPAALRAAIAARVAETLGRLLGARQDQLRWVFDVIMAFDG